jgi:hypothetical protein
MLKFRDGKKILPPLGRPLIVVSGRGEMATAIVTVLNKDWRKVLLKNNDEVFWSEPEFPDHVKALIAKKW